MAWTGALGQNCLKCPPALARDADAVLDARVAVVMPVHPPTFGFVKRVVASVDHYAQHLHFRPYLVFAAASRAERAADGQRPGFCSRGFCSLSDAPLYERKDFGDFLERFDWELAFRGELEGYIFDHISYLCYKLRVAN